MACTVEAIMGAIQKIFYIHLPLAWWGLVSFGVTAVSGLLYLKKHDLKYDHIAHASAEIGLIFCTLTLITGMIWGRRSWGVWWTWDPRLTTALVLWFLYAGYMVLRNLDMPSPRRASICSVLGAIAFLDVPIVFFSARLWRSIHPAVFGAEGGGLEPEMLIGVLVSIASFGLFWIAMLLWKSRILGLKEKLEERTSELVENW